MKTAKLLFYAVVLFLMVMGAFAVFGLIVSAAQYLIWLGAIILIGFVVVKLLQKKPEQRPELEVSQAERELQAAIRRIEEIKRAQLPEKK